MNNTTFYLFGQLTKGFDVTVKDHTEPWFRELTKASVDHAFIWVGRQDQLMHYAYLTPLASGGFFGICLVLNGVAYCSFSPLFSCLQNFTEQLILRGGLIGLDERGEVVAQADNFQSVLAEVTDVQTRLQYEIGSLRDLTPLPPLDYSGNEETIECDLACNLEHDIYPYTVGRGGVFLYHSKAVASASMQSYRQRLADLYAEKEEMAERLQEQTELTNMARLEAERVWKEKQTTAQNAFLYEKQTEEKGSCLDGCNKGCSGCVFAIIILLLLGYLATQCT